MLALLVLLVASDPAQANDLLRQGLIALGRDQPQEARQDLEAAAKSAPDNPYIWTSLAETYMRLHNPAKAMASAQTAAKYRNGNPAIAHALAMFYTETQNYEKAAALEQEYAASRLADAGALSRAAQLYLDASDAIRALPLAKQAAAAHPTAANDDLLGRAYIGQNKFDLGLESLATANTSDPTDPAIAFDYAQALFQKEDFAKAADALLPALNVHPNNAQLELALGVARYGQRRFSDAIDAFLRTISMDPTVAQPYRFLGQMLDQAGNKLHEIKKAYEERYKRFPNEYQMPFLLAKAELAGNEDPALIEKNLRESIRLNDDFWQSHFELGQLLEKEHHYAGAAKELERSIALKPSEPEPHYHLARVYDRLGQPQKAKEQREIHAKLTTAQRNAPQSEGMGPGF